MVKTNKVKARIIELGLNYDKVADSIGIDYTTLSYKLSNKRRIYLDETIKLCKILELTSTEQLKDYFNFDFLI